MNSFIKVPNALFNFEKIGNRVVREYPLKPIDLYVYLYLLASNYDNKGIKRKIKTIAERCNVNDTKTIHSSISRLESMGLLTSSSRYNFIGFKIANEYKVTTIDGDFFMLDRRYLNFNLGTSAFCVLMYLLRCHNSVFACPSVNKISSATGLSEPTIRLKITALQQRLYLSKSYQYSQYGDHSNNHYYINTYEIRENLFSIYRRIKRKTNKILIKLNTIKIKSSILKMFGSFVFLKNRVGKLFPNSS